MGKLDRLAEKIDPHQRHIKRSASAPGARELIERIKATAKPDRGDHDGDDR